MSNGNGHRWSKFWWQDWKNDDALRGCSLAARGLWMGLLCIAHDAEPRGSVLVNGRIPSAKKLADIIGSTTEREVVKLLVELEAEGVFSRNPDGTIYSRRMVRDAAASEAGREHITKRWGGNGQESHPNSPPIRGATSRPNREGHSPPTAYPFTRSLEAEEEARPSRSPPTEWEGAPLSGDPNADGKMLTPQLTPRQAGTNPRAAGTNPRATAGNPRKSATNPRAKGDFSHIKNGFVASILRDMENGTYGPKQTGNSPMDPIAWLAHSD